MEESRGGKRSLVSSEDAVPEEGEQGGLGRGEGRDALYPEVLELLVQQKLLRQVHFG